MSKEEHQLHEFIRETVNKVLGMERPCKGDTAVFSGVADRTPPKPPTYRGGDELTVPVIAAAILSTRNGQHEHAADDLQMVIDNIRPDLMARAHDHLFDVWLKSKIDEYLTHAWPTAAKRYEELNDGGPLPKRPDGQRISAESFMDNANFFNARDYWLERHCKTIRKLTLDEKFDLAASGSLWVCENLFTGFLASGKEHEE